MSLSPFAIGPMGPPLAPQTGSRPPGPGRFRGRFRTRITAWLIALSATVSLASGIAYYRQQLRFVQANQHTRGRTLSSTLASQSELGVYSGDATFLSTPVRQAFNQSDVSFVVIYDRLGDPQLRRIKPEADRAPELPDEVLRALQRHPQDTAPRIRRTEHHVDFYAPISGPATDPEAALFSPRGDRNAVLFGVAHVGLSLRPAQEQLRRVVSASTQLSLLTLALGVIVALLVSKRLSRPVLELASSADRLAAGQLGLQIPVERSDELGALADSFNHMSDTLHRTVSRLAHFNQHLEDEVAKRTRELEQRNLALAQQRDKLREVSRLKSEFLANMTHELRTPLNAVIGYAELIADGIYGEVNQEQQQSLKAIAESGGHLLELINDILDLSKAESGRINVEWRQLDVCQLVRDVLEETKPLARDRPYEITAELPRRLGLVSDEARIRQILVNLIGNAVKFTEQGSVSVTVRRGTGDSVCIEVRDTGVGIAEEHQQLIFDAFRQVDGSSTRAHGGTGLGLAISQKLSLLLGGRLEVVSRVGQGSTFTLVLPQEPRDEAHSPVNAPMQGSAG